ncbi:N,N-dimethylformamidase beta subunit family domain-containing protein, partial [Sphingobium wenxiniae]
PPDDLPSGVYAFYLLCDGGEDKVPFFVTARPGDERAPVAVLMPTLSYQVYANSSSSIIPTPTRRWRSRRRRSDDDADRPRPSARRQAPRAGTGRPRPVR